MESSLIEIRIEGKTFRVPSTRITGRTIIVNGKWLKLASIHDEQLIEGVSCEHPDEAVSQLKSRRVKADLFTFAQKPAEDSPKHAYYFERDNAAAIPITTFSEWWEKRLPQETRRNVKRAAKCGVSVQTARFDDQFVRGVVNIYNETPVRQGRRFWHYQKGFEVVKEETGTYFDRSEFIGAYHNDELIGFIKLVYVDKYANIIHILSLNRHREKRSTNALLAKAVEICVEKGLSFLLYDKYMYDNNDKSPLTEFKRRNGFEELRYPRYYVPLTAKGRVILKAGLHHGLAGLLPKNVLAALLGLRRRYFETIEQRA